MFCCGNTIVLDRKIHEKECSNHRIGVNDGEREL